MTETTLPADQIQNLALFASGMSTVAGFYRTQLIAAGFSEPIAESMAERFQSSILSMMETTAQEAGITGAVKAILANLTTAPAKPVAKKAPAKKAAARKAPAKKAQVNIGTVVVQAPDPKTVAKVRKTVAKKAPTKRAPAKRPSRASTARV